jgi:hypothetical protein
MRRAEYEMPRGGGVPGWVPLHPETGRPLRGFASISRGRFWHDGELPDLQSWLASARLTLRGADGTRPERGPDGQLADVYPGEPRLVHDRFGGRRGLRFSRPASTGIRNNAMAGAEAGTPGRLPDHWFHSNRESGLDISVAGTGVEGGVPYVDIRWHGIVRKSGVIITFMDAPDSVAAQQGMSMTGSCFVRLAGGSLANTSGHYIRVDGRVNERVAADAETRDFVPADRPLDTQRIHVTAEITDERVRAASLSQRFQLGAVGSEVDLTLRLGAPMLHAGRLPAPLLLSRGEPVSHAGDYLAIEPEADALGSPADGGLFGIRYLMEGDGGGDIALPFIAGSAERPSLALCGPDVRGQVLAIVSGLAGRSVLRAPETIRPGRFLTAVLGWHPLPMTGAALSVNGCRPVVSARGCTAAREDGGCIGLHLDGVVDEIFFDAVRWPDTGIQALSI